MTDVRVRKLESIGFEWSAMITASETNWESIFQELQSYKVEHGHCNVPTKSGKLGTWVVTQRDQYRLLKEGKTSYMADERVQKLESIGFQWSIRPQNISAMQPPSTASDAPLKEKSGKVCLLLARSSIFSTYFMFLTAVLGSRIFGTTYDAYCKDPSTFSTDSKMDDLDDKCGVSLDEPIVASSPAVSKKLPVFRPFLLGTGYC